MYEFFKKMRKWTEDFEPSNIFYTVVRNKYVWEAGSSEDFKYTKLGRWFKDKPDIVSIAKFPYYLITWIYKVIGTTVYVLAHTCFPKSWNL
jgi:hypothetical protein